MGLHLVLSSFVICVLSFFSSDVLGILSTHLSKEQMFFLLQNDKKMKRFEIVPGLFYIRF